MSFEKRMELCERCAALLADGYDVRLEERSRDWKVTCGHCGNRRFGAVYVVRPRGKAKTEI